MRMCVCTHIFKSTHIYIYIYIYIYIAASDTRHRDAYGLGRKNSAKSMSLSKTPMASYQFRQPCDWINGALNLL